MDPAAPPLPPISPDDFFRADVRLGQIVAADAFPEARKPAWKLKIDFGPVIGMKTSSAQITELYPRESLPGRRVLAVVNFPPRQIGPVRSEVLVLGVQDAQGRVCLLSADADAPLGARVA